MPTPNVPNVTPNDIDTGRPFWEAFGRMETDASAAVIIRFCQHRGNGWEPIPIAQLMTFGTRRGVAPTFRRLQEMGYVVVRNDEMMLTPEFILRCHQASPRS